MSVPGDAKSTLNEARSSARKFHKTFWETENSEEDANDDSEANDALLKTVSGSSSLDADGGSCGVGDDAFCLSNLVWLVAAIVVAYRTDFFDVVILSALRGGYPEANVLFYYLGLFFLSTNLAIFYYLVVHLSWNRGVKSGDWDSYIPYAVPVATAAFLGAGICLSIGLWPIWGVFTFPILSFIFMGFIVVISMTSQIYKRYRFRFEKERKLK